jgi:uncharacterized protein
MIAPRVAHVCVRVLAAVAVVVALLLPRDAHAAFKPPPLRGHIADPSGQLTPDDALYLDNKLESFRRRTGFELVALVLRSLEGETIDDVAYTAFNTWEVGDKGRDNGVLLVISTGDRKVRIETGKGVGGALTDLQSNDIIRETIAPRLREGRLRDAIDDGSGAIANALMSGSTPAERAPPKLSPLTIGIGIAVLVVIVVLLIVSPTFRSIFFFVLQIFSIFGGR